MDIRHWMTLCEGSKRKITPAEQYIMAVQAQGRCSNCTLEPWDTKTVHLAWLESDGQPLVPFLVSLADQLGVKLVLAVEVVDSDYGGKLVRYYEQHGFTIVGSDFDDDFDFLNMEPSEDLQGEVSMEREPRRHLGEAAMWNRRWRNTLVLKTGHTLYHGTNAEFDPEDDDLLAPAWFSSSPSVAQHFARGGTVRTYRVTQPIRLPVITSRGDRERFFEMFGIDDASAEDIADSMQGSGLPGWIIPNNYPDGDDILLVDLSSLRRVDDD